MTKRPQRNRTESKNETAPQSNIRGQNGIGFYCTCTLVDDSYIYTWLDRYGYNGYNGYNANKRTRLPTNMMNSLNVVNGCILGPLRHAKSAFVLFCNPEEEIAEEVQQPSISFSIVSEVLVFDDTASVSSFDALPKDIDPADETQKKVKIQNFEKLQYLMPRSWSIQVTDGGYRSGETLTFRLVRNSKPNAAMYLQGEEVFHSINAVLETDAESTFYVQFDKNDREAHLANNGNIHTLLKRAIYRSKLMHCGGTSLIREMLENKLRKKQSAQALAVMQRHACSDYQSLPLPDLYFLVHHGKTLQELLVAVATHESVLTESLNKRNSSPTSSTQSPSASNGSSGSDESYQISYE